MLLFFTSFKKKAIALLICLICLGCYNSTSDYSSSSKWVKTIDETVDLTRFRQSNYETLSIEDTEDKPISVIDSEKNKQGDKRTYFKSELFYKTDTYPQFKGTLELNYLEVPFSNQYALILKISSSLKDKENKRTREFLPKGNNECYLILTSNTNSELKDTKVSHNYSFYWDSQKENSGYSAFLSPSEFRQLKQAITSEKNSRLYLSFANSQYDISSLKTRLIQDSSFIAKSVQERQNIAELSLKTQSIGINSYYEFFSPWIPINSFYIKIGTLYSPQNDSFNQVQLILGSYDPDVLRKVFSGNSFLIFSTQQQIFLLDLQKMNFFNSLQQKESSLLSFSLIDNEPEELRKISKSWKELPKQFWQVNLNSKSLNIGDLKTILKISQSSERNLSLSLSENLNFTQGNWLTYFLELIKELITVHENNKISQLQ